MPPGAQLLADLWVVRPHPAAGFGAFDGHQVVIQPPSTRRSTPFMAGFSSRKRTASTMSAIRVNRLVGVRARMWSRFLPDQNGLSPTIPGWRALTRIGA